MTAPQANGPRVTVVVPSLNREEHIREALDSILSQDYTDIECIVADGGSTDGTLDALRTYGDRIRWDSGPDGGPFNGINRSWQSSSGEILAWLNADDAWVPGTVSRAVVYLNEHPGIDVVYGQCRWIDGASRPRWVSPAVPWDLTAAVLYCDSFIHQPTAFLRREVAERVGWLHSSWFHDQDLWLRIALAGGRFGTMDEVQAEARIHRGKGGQDPILVEAAKVSMVDRWFKDLPLPGPLVSQRTRALSNARARALDSLWPTLPSNWAIGFRILGRAISTDPKNAPAVVGHVCRLVGRFVARMVVPSPLN